MVGLIIEIFITKSVNKMKHLVFVYGSLKRGFGNHFVLGDSTYKGTLVTRDNFTMYSFDAFPAIKKDTHGLPILGELFEVSDKILKDLDTLEGHPTFYKRQPLALSDGQVVHGYVYVDDICSQKIINPENGIYNWRRK